MKGSFPLKGSTGPFLLRNGSITSELNGWKGSPGLEDSTRLTGVVLPEDATDGENLSLKYRKIHLRLLQTLKYLQKCVIGSWKKSYVFSKSNILYQKCSMQIQDGEQT